MRNRTIKKQIWLNQTEDNLLKEKSKKANISEAEFLRNCINGFEVQEKPDENFYYILRDLRGIATNINQLARNANRYGYYADVDKYKKDFQKVSDFIVDIQEMYLNPVKKEYYGYY